MTDIAVGDILMRRYRVEKLLGAGGMGMVLAVRHIHLDELFAIKIVRPELIHDDEIVQRFLQEAQSCARLKSPHVARVTDVDRLPSGEPFMVMEHLSGEDLGAYLRDKGRLPVLDAVNYVVQACDAIGEAHAIGILHRDLKPANLFLTKDRYGAPMIKVLDFGISKVLDRDDDEELTRTTVAMGTPQYMPPEQFVNARQVTARSDIWSLGCVLYRTLTNELPFRRDENRTVEEVVRTTEPLPPRKLRPEIPEALEAVILRCLRKKKDERFPTAGALAEALCAAVGLPLPSAGPVPTPQRDPTPQPSPPQPSPPPAETPSPLTNRGQSTVPDGGGPERKPVEPTQPPVDPTNPHVQPSPPEPQPPDPPTPSTFKPSTFPPENERSEPPLPPKRDLRWVVGAVMGLSASFLVGGFLIRETPTTLEPIHFPLHGSISINREGGLDASAEASVKDADGAGVELKDAGPDADDGGDTGPRPLDGGRKIPTLPRPCNPQLEFCIETTKPPHK